MKPLHDYVLIKPDQVVKKSLGGIHLPDTNKNRSNQGTVVAVGSGRIGTNGEVNAVDLKVEDCVIYSPYDGTDVEIDRVTHKLIKERDVFAVLG